MVMKCQIVRVVFSVHVALDLSRSSLVIPLTGLMHCNYIAPISFFFVGRLVLNSGRGCSEIETANKEKG